MLRNLLIVSSSGIVLFAKDFTSALSQPRLLGGLITAMLKASVIRTGYPVSLIEFDNVAVAIQSDSKCKVSCSLFYDKEDVIRDNGRCVIPEPRFQVGTRVRTVTGAGDPAGVRPAVLVAARADQRELEGFQRVQP